MQNVVIAGYACAPFHPEDDVLPTGVRGDDIAARAACVPVRRFRNDHPRAGRGSPMAGPHAGMTGLPPSGPFPSAEHVAARRFHRLFRQSGHSTGGHGAFCAAAAFPATAQEHI